MAAKKWDASGEIDVHFPLLAYLLNIKELYPEQKAALKEFFLARTCISGVWNKGYLFMGLFCCHFYGPCKWRQQRPTKRQHMQGMLDETAPLTVGNI